MGFCRSECLDRRLFFTGLGQVRDADVGLHVSRKPEHDPGSVDKLVQPYIAARQSVSQQRGKRKPFRGR